MVFYLVGSAGSFSDVDNQTAEYSVILGEFALEMILKYWLKHRLIEWHIVLLWLHNWGLAMILLLLVYWILFHRCHSYIFVCHIDSMIL